MPQPLARPHYSPEEYLAIERQSEERHEYLDGEIVAMSGGTREHSLLASHLIRELGIALLDRPCEVHGSDLRISLETGRRYTYADVVVLCGEPAFDNGERDTLLNPQVIFEVLSDSTENYDRGEKFEHYRALKSLTDYLLVSQKRIRVEHYQRQQGDRWLLETLGPGQRIKLVSLGCELAVEEIYRRVLPPQPRPAV